MFLCVIVMFLVILTTLAVSKWPSKLYGHFKTSLGFEMAWPFQGPTSQSTLDLFHNALMGMLLNKVSIFQTLFRP